MKKFLQNLRNAQTIGSLNDGNRRDRREAKRLLKKGKCNVK